MELTHCSSLDCHNYNCDYCPDCSHSIYFGEGTDKNGKLWRWEFNTYFGPLFLRKDGEPMKIQPVSEHHVAWEPFEKWFEEKWIVRYYETNPNGSLTYYKVKI